MRKKFLLFLSLFAAATASAQFSGTYTINSNSSQNPDFTSFSAAASALSAGVSGQVVFEVAPGTYEEYVTFNSINGTSETNRVIFRGMGADNQQVVLTTNAGYTSNSTLTLDGPDYVTFENMTLASTSENTAIVVTLRGGLTNDRFENVRFVGCFSDASNTDNNKNLVYRVSGGWMDTDNAFVGCEFVNGFIGLYYQGSDMTQYNDGLLVENCSFTNQCSKSIYATFTDHVTLTGNIIENTNDSHTDYNASEGRYCDYNRVSYSGGNVGNYAGYNYAGLEAWTANTGFDAHSGVCLPEFVGENDLHITDANGLTVDNSLDYVVTDIDGENRSATPCAGADEYINGVNLPPVVANPIADIVFETFPANQTVDLNETFDDPDDPNEDIVISVVSNDNPSLVGVTLDNRSLLVERLIGEGGSALITLEAESNGQTVQTSFTVECIAEDLPPVVVNPLAPIHFTDFPQTLNFDVSTCFDDPDNNNEMMTFAVQSGPSEVAASVDNGGQLSVVRLTPEAFANGVLVIRATSNGKFVDMNVDVSGDEVTVEVDVADFEDVELGPEGYWQGQEGDNEMLSHGWAFTNYYSEYFWGGFTASNRTDLNQTGMGAQYTAAPGVGYDGSAQYAVAYTYGAQTDVYAADGEPHTVSGCYVTNNLWAYQNMLEGDYSVTPFGGPSGNDPDWFKLTATGKNANGQTVGALDFYLADYRFDNPEDDYILDTWEWFDLSPLGEVASISFSLESTKQNYGGMITPAYFCMDNFNGNTAIDLPPYIVNPVNDVSFDVFPQTIEFDLEGVATDPDDPDENIVYGIVDNPHPEALTASMNGRVLTLVRETEGEAEFELTMRATSDGQYVDFNIFVIIKEVEGVGENTASFMVYPNPSHDMVTIAVDGDSGFEYQVFDMTGRTLLRGRCEGQEAMLDMSDSGKGIYLISVTCDAKHLMQKVIVQ